MKKLITLLLLLAATPGYAAQRATLQEGNGTEIGTAANPLKVSITAGAAPTDADYLVGTTNSGLSAEIVVGATPGGELGNTWASPTIDDSVTVTGWVLGTSTATTFTTTNLGATTATGVITLAENSSIALDPANSADGKYTGTTITGTAGATLAFGDLIYLDPTDSRWELADANAAAAADGDSRGILGICVLAAAADASATTILLQGIVRADAVFPALTIGAPVYVSETAGDIVVTQPVTTDVVIRIVGIAITADEIFFNPDNTWVTHT